MQPAQLSSVFEGKNCGFTDVPQFSLKYILLLLLRFAPQNVYSNISYFRLICTSKLEQRGTGLTQLARVASVFGGKNLIVASRPSDTSIAASGVLPLLQLTIQPKMVVRPYEGSILAPTPCLPSTSSPQSFFSMWKKPTSRV